MEHIGEKRNHRFFLITMDLLMVLAAYVSAFYVRYFDFPGRNWDAFIALLPWIMIIALFFIAVYELYSFDRKYRISDMLRKIIVAVAMMTFFTMAASYLFREFAMPRSVVLIASIFTVLLMIIFRVVYLKFIRGNVIGRVLLIGNEQNSDKITNKVTHPLMAGTKIVRMHSHRSVSEIDEALETCDYVIICPDLAKEKKSQIIYHAMERSITVYVIPTFYELLLQKASTAPLDDTLLMGVKPFIMPWDQVLIKRVFDFVSSLLITIILLPVFIGVAIVVKLEDPKSPVIYSQERLGKFDRPFTIYKFRSMIADAEKLSGPTLASADDNRITKVGKFIRSTRLDELPQLFNVIKGDMSLVGPRPEREYFINQLAKQYYHYGYRNRVQPGITGYAQVMGKYSTDAEDKLRFDLYYIRHYSLWLDFVILLKTVLVVFDKSASEGTEEKKEKSKESETWQAK